MVGHDFRIKWLDFGGDLVQNPYLVQSSWMLICLYTVRIISNSSYRLIESVVVARWEHCSRRWFEISDLFELLLSSTSILNYRDVYVQAAVTSNSPSSVVEDSLQPASSPTSLQLSRLSPTGLQQTLPVSHWRLLLTQQPHPFVCFCYIRYMSVILQFEHIKLIDLSLARRLINRP